MSEVLFTYEKQQPFNLEQRRYNDTTTWLAEVIDGSMRTSFEYGYDQENEELYASDGQNLGEIFDKSIEEAEQLAKRDPKMSFELRRRKLEVEEYNLMVMMARDQAPNTMVVVSDFPAELMERKEDVGGYNVTRKQTMLRVITKGYDNNIKIISQSLDGSDRESLESIYAQFSLEPDSGELLGQRIHIELSPEDQDIVVDKITGAYDRTLQKKFGGQFRAGRRQPWQGNTYDFVIKQQDLLNTYLESDLDVYDLAAAMQARYDNQTTKATGRIKEENVVMGYFANRPPEQEILLAGQKARFENKTFSGCGMSVSSKNTTEGSPAQDNLQDQLGDLGYGNKSEEFGEDDKYGSLHFKCPKGHRNKRPRNQLIEKCQVCKCSVRC